MMIWLIAWLMLWLWRLLDVPEQPEPESGAFYLDDYLDGDRLLPQFQTDADEFAFLLLPNDLPWQLEPVDIYCEYDAFEQALDELEAAIA